MPVTDIVKDLDDLVDLVKDLKYSEEDMVWMNDKDLLHVGTNAANAFEIVGEIITYLTTKGKYNVV